MNHRWTDADRELLAQLASTGVSSVEIAERIGTTWQTVDQYRGQFSRRETCVVCNARLQYKGYGRRPVYCSPACVAAYERAKQHNAYQDRKPRVCEQCHGLIPDGTRGRRYCSKRCGSRAWHERVRVRTA